MIVPVAVRPVSMCAVAVVVAGWRLTVLVVLAVVVTGGVVVRRVLVRPPAVQPVVALAVVMAVRDV